VYFFLPAPRLNPFWLEKWVLSACRLIQLLYIIWPVYIQYFPTPSSPAPSLGRCRGKGNKGMGWEGGGYGRVGLVIFSTYLHNASTLENRSYFCIHLLGTYRQYLWTYRLVFQTITLPVLKPWSSFPDNVAYHERRTDLILQPYLHLHSSDNPNSFFLFLPNL
jgi:hypothetical protein